MKKLIACALSAVTMMASLSGCSFLNGLGGNNDNWQDYDNLAEFYATEYDNDAVVAADETDAGDVDSWHAQVYTKTGGNNDMPTNNALIRSPYHTLKVNGKEVPVYSARAAKGVHSFAWLDVKGAPKNFALKVELTLSEDFAKCVVLPESRNVEVKIAEQTVTSYLTEYRSFTYTFADEVVDDITDPTLAPLTIMVAPEAELEIPEGYNKVEIEPGYHEDRELVFQDEEMVYVMKKGLHEITEIRVPSNSILFLERGAYLQATERGSDADGWNTATPIHFDDITNSKLISRGLLDCGKLLGGDGKHKHVFNAARSSDLHIEGLTIINANTWSMCFYSNENVEIERNLLISYRTYSDGIMMSECRDSVGRYNFVRTGDDSIEFKGTGWWNGTTPGSNCVYEYNDLWTDKGAGYCLTYENNCAMSNMVFRNNSIGFAQPNWADRCTAIDVLLGINPETVWGNVTFENIEIYHVESPNVMQIYLKDNSGTVENITFQNITVKSISMNTRIFRLAKDAPSGSISNVLLKNIMFTGKKLVEADKENMLLIDNDAPTYMDQVTIE